MSETNYDEQFKMGLKLIISSYEEKYQKMENDLNILNGILTEKDQIIFDLESKMDELITKNKEIYQNYEKVSSDNTYLLEALENLTREAKKLENFKKNIIHSIEKNDNQELTDENENNYVKKKVQINFSNNKQMTKAAKLDNKSIQSLSINSSDEQAKTNKKNAYNNPQTDYPNPQNQANSTRNKDLNFNYNRLGMNKEKEINYINYLDSIKTQNDVGYNIINKNSYIEKKSDNKDFKIDNNKIDQLIEKLNDSISKRMNSEGAENSKGSKNISNISKSKDLENKIFDLKKKFKEKKLLNNNNSSNLNKLENLHANPNPHLNNQINDSESN